MAHDGSRSSGALRTPMELLAVARRRGMQIQRRRRAVAVGCGCLVAVTLGAGVVAAVPGPGGREVRVLTPPATGATTTTTATSLPPPPTTSAVPTSVPAVPIAHPVTTTPVPTNTTTGTVTGPDGRPVANAYVIGLTNLNVVQTDARGRFAMPCVAQKLVAATWVLPVQSPQPGPSGGYRYRSDTTDYPQGTPPAGPGPGYVFSGGASRLSGAATVACNGSPVNFQLPPGGAVDIRWVHPPRSGQNGPIDNLNLPGLENQAALETVDVSSTGHQVLSQLGPGTLEIHPVATPFTCSGPGVTGSDGIYTVAVAAGQVSPVTCMVTSR